MIKSLGKIVRLGKVVRLGKIVRLVRFKKSYCDSTREASSMVFGSVLPVMHFGAG